MASAVRIELRESEIFIFRRRSAISSIGTPNRCSVDGGREMSQLANLQ